MSAEPVPLPDGYAPAHKAAAVRALVAAALFALAELRRLDPEGAEAERVRARSAFARKVAP